MTTFPFLKIARERGLPYGVVIRAAEEAYSRSLLGYPSAIPLPVLDEIVDAVEAEKTRRRLILTGETI